MYEAQVARATQSCIGFAVGERTITRNPIASEDHRWEGRIDNPAYRERVWRDGTIEGVITDMEKALGPVPETDYQIVE